MMCKRISLVLLTAMVVFTGCTVVGVAYHTVTFISSGGNVVDKQVVTNGSTATQPEDPTRTGYVFDGWYLGSTSAAYNFNTPVTANIILAARWIKDDGTIEYCNITWNLNGGAWPEGSNPTARVIKGNTLAKPNAPVKDGSTFEGWYSNAALTSKITFPCTVIANMTLYAKWMDDGNSSPAINNEITAVVEDGLILMMAVDNVKAVLDGSSFVVGSGAYGSRDDFTVGFTVNLDATVDAQYLNLFKDMYEGITLSDPNVMIATVIDFIAYRSGTKKGSFSCNDIYEPSETMNSTWTWYGASTEKTGAVYLLFPTSYQLLITSCRNITLLLLFTVFLRTKCRNT